MPKYTVEAPDGKRVTFEWTGSAPPNDADMEEVFRQAGEAVKPKVAQEYDPEWAKNHPNVYGAVMALRNTLGPILEAGGAAGGGIVGAGAGLPTGPGAAVSGVAGAGLGYAGVRQALNSLDEALGLKAPSTLPDAAKEAAKDVAIGSTMEAGGQVAGKLLSAGAGKIAEKAQKSAQKMYASSLKLETGKNISQAERSARIKTGLEAELPPTEKSLKKLGNMIDEIDNAIQRPIEEAQGKTVKTSKILQNLDDLKTKFTDQAIPDDDLAAIDRAKELFSARRGEEIPIELAQRIKKGTYVQLKGKYGKLGASAIESEKTIARGLKDEIYKELEKQHPELAELGRKEGAYLALNDSLEKAVKRIQNRDIIGLGTPMTTGVGSVVAGKPGAIAAFTAKVADMPIVKARLAIALNKASQRALAKEAIKKATALNRGRALVIAPTVTMRNE